jgi:hypothetical protein
LRHRGRWFRFGIEPFRFSPRDSFPSPALFQIETGLSTEFEGICIGREFHLAGINPIRQPQDRQNDDLQISCATGPPLCALEVVEIVVADLLRERESRRRIGAAALEEATGDVTMTSTPTIWITAPKRQPMSTPSCRRSIGQVLAAFAVSFYPERSSPADPPGQMGVMFRRSADKR